MNKKIKLEEAKIVCEKRNFCIVRYVSANKKMETSCNTCSYLWTTTLRRVRNGVQCPNCTGRKRLSIKNVEEKIKNIHGKFVTLKTKTYKNVNTPAIFIDAEYGEFVAYPCNVLYQKNRHPKKRLDKCKQSFLKKYGVDHLFKCKAIREKIIQTNLRKYGVEYPAQNTEIALKTSKSARFSCVLRHWKTNKEVVCVGSYEKSVVKHLNERKINFEWQPKTFITPIKTPTGKKSTYRPDAFLPDQNLWVEIKGYMRPRSKLKWEWFHSVYPNSELWDRKRLKQMGLIKS